MRTFWTKFMKEQPASIRTTARLAYLKEFTVPVGQTQMSLLMVDMPKLAAKYPSVATALKEAGLTAEQHQAYRIALISAMATKEAEGLAGPVDTTSILGKNTKFLDQIPQGAAAIQAPIWVNP